MTTTSPATAPTQTPEPGTTAPDDLLRLARTSHRVITDHQAASGAYPACPTFSAYAGYAWYRDGAFTAEGISRYGDVDSADAFHDWAQRVLVDRAPTVQALVDEQAAGRPPENAQMLPTRFRLDGSQGSEPWWDFQLDGYGTWLWSVVTHATRHGLDLGRWARGVEVAVDYLTAFWDRPCFDWWEEHDEHHHVSTLGAVVGGLRAAADSGLLDAAREQRARTAVADGTDLVLREGVHDGHLVKWLGSTEVDASLLACVAPFHLVPPGQPLAVATLRAVVRDLDVDGGVHRFRADVFYGGGQWPLLTAFVGWNMLAAGDRVGAAQHLHWVAAQADPDGLLPEQVPHHLLAPEHHQEWVDRWGPVAAPLLWSHGMYLVLADELGVLGQREAAR